MPGTPSDIRPEEGRSHPKWVSGIVARYPLLLLIHEVNDDLEWLHVPMIVRETSIAGSCHTSRCDNRD
jgi:hypothetical protein